ncbi:hypothetical protein M408DRAFT_27038 [Serendipita vermifera MAFF 305830]|uniref:Uncharacterized protein n=1 Tax=Serendipita vermifera MAFF 305830 TaxID=933852 RepID=A0A0C3AWK8_SERVB|nr:hypothetical protein M408DRAFT_27038 [Serendipita vermifera MAFF 305830]
MDYTRSVDNIEDITLFVSDLLPSLKSLIIVYKGRDPIAQTIRGMTTGLRTSRPGLTLSVIDIHPISAHAVIEPPVEIATINRMYGGRLGQISSLVLPNLGGNSVKVDFLPKHVNRVECSWRQDHLFPHVRSYKLSGCTFARGSKHDLGSLVSLTVAIDLSVRMACHFFFPSLRFFSCGGIRLEHRSSLRAPALEQFQLNFPPFHILERIKMAKTTEAALQTSSFVMLPNLSLVIKDCLQTHTIVQFLRRCGHVENVSLTFSDEADVLAFIEDLSREEPFEHIRTEEESSPIRSGPIVSELKLNLLSSQLDRKDLKSKIADLMRTTGSATLPLKIYSSQNELEYHLSLLEIQLSRTGGLPLDVVYFYPSSHEHDEKILNVFRESGSFQCWQSLTLRMDYASVFDTQNYLTIFVSNVFPNIKTIKIIHAGSRASSVLSLIEQAAAPRYTDTLRRPATLRLEVIDVNMSTAIVNKACIKYKSSSAYLWEQQFSDFEHRPPQYYWD